MFNQKILALIEEYDTIIIHRHQRPDPDAVGSQIGLAESLRATYPEKHIYAVGETEPTLRYLGKMDEIDDDVYQGALVIVNDTANTPRIDDDRYDTGAVLVKVDHHPDREPYGDVRYVDETASSVSEIWASVILSDDNALQMPTKAARAFFMGIVGDTGRFLFDNTTPKTLHTAAELLKHPFHAARLLSVTNTHTLGQARLQGYVYQHLTVTDSGKVASVVVPREVLAQCGVTEAESYVVVQLPGSIYGVSAWASFVEQADGSYRAHLRSKGPAINEIAAQHDGGGHPKASGATVHDQAEIAALVSELDAAAQQYHE